jgi:hypothetical protein
MTELDTGRKTSPPLWLCAGLVALGLHVGGAAFALAHLQNEDSDESSGTPAIEVGLELTSPHREATDLPPGPESEAAVASPALAEQKAEVKDTDLPRTRRPRPRIPTGS